jgi:hypothetical protein
MAGLVSPLSFPEVVNAPSPIAPVQYPGVVPVKGWVDVESASREDSPAGEAATYKRHASHKRNPRFTAGACSIPAR